MTGVSRYEVKIHKHGTGKVGNSIIRAGHQRTATLTGLEAGVTYTVYVRPQLKVNGVNQWHPNWALSPDIIANTPPQSGTTLLADNTSHWGSVYWEDISSHFTDTNGDSFTYEVSVEHPGIAEVWMEAGTGDNKDARLIHFRALNPATTTSTYGVHDGYGGYAASTFKVVGVANETRSVPENSPAGTHVGRPVQGAPYDDGDPETDDTLTHTLTWDTGHEDAGDLFAIDSATGQISLKQGATLDYETKSSYTGKVRWTVQGQDAVASVTINVADVEAGQPDAPTVARAEFSEETPPALDVTWTAPDSNGLTISWHALQYRKKAAAGEEAAEWTNFDDHVLVTTSARLSGLEAGATYEVQVRACTNEEDCGPWSDTGEGRANSPPTVNPAAPAPRSHYTSRVLYGIRLGGEPDHPVDPYESYFLDGDGDTLTYSPSAEHLGILHVALNQRISDLRFLEFLNPSTTTLTDGASDGYGGYVSRTVTVTGKDFPTREVAENSPAGTTVGDPVTGTPYDDGNDATDDSLKYTLTGDAATAFVIDSATGQISVKQGATLDYETKSSYTGQVNWTVQGQAAAADVTINVTDVGPGQPGAPTLTRTQFEVETPPALDATWTEAAANGFTITGYEVQYRVKAAEDQTANSWTLHKYDDPDNPSTEISLLSATAMTVTLPDLTPGATYEVQVRARTDDTATNGEDTGPWSDTGEGRANRPPTVNPYGPDPFGSRGFGLIKGVLMNDYLGGDPDHPEFPYQSQFVDEDGDTLTYSSSAEHPGILTIHVRPISNGLRYLEFLNPGTTNLTAAASDGYGGYVSRTAPITASDPQTREVAENSPAGTLVGAPVTGTPYDDGDDETDDTLTHTLTFDTEHEDADDLFVIDAATGQISVAAGASLDYETKSSYTGKVNWTIQDQAVAADVTINVTDVEAVIASAPTLTRTPSDPPMNPALDVTWAAADGNGLTVTGYNVQYRKKAADGEDPAEWTEYTRTYTDPEDQTEKSTSKLPATARTVTLPNLEAGETYEVQVRALTDASANAEDIGPWSDTGEGRANRPPTVNPGAPAPRGSRGLNHVTGRLYGDYLGGEPDHPTDPTQSYFLDEDGDALTYSSFGKYPGIISVSMSENASDLRLFKFLNPGTTDLTAVASDGYGGYAARVATITASDPQTREVAENSPAGTLVGAPVTGTPYDYDGNPETDDPLTYTLTWDSGHEVAEGLFVINQATGQISVAEGASLDYETTSSYTGKVNWTIHGQVVFATLTINVTDVEATIPSAPTLTRTPSDVPMNPALDVTWTAAEANGLTVVNYGVQYRKKAADGEQPAAWTNYTFDCTLPGEQPGEEVEATCLVVPPTQTSVTLTDLEAGAVYEAQVQAFTDAATDGEDRGPWSDTGEGRANRPPRGTGVGFTPWRGYWKVLQSEDGADTHFADDDGDSLTYISWAEYPGILETYLNNNLPNNIRRLYVEPLNPRVGGSKVYYRAQDGYGGAADPANFWVNINSDTYRDIAENSPAGTLVGAPVTGTPYDDGDPETDDTLSYTLTDGTGGDVTSAFVINSATGQISVAEDVTLDYETKSSYTGKVNWTVQGQAAAADVTINVTDVGPGQPGAPTLTRTQFEVETPPALDVTWTEAAANGFTITGYEVQYRVKAAEDQTANSGGRSTNTTTPPTPAPKSAFCPPRP